MYKLCLKTTNNSIVIKNNSLTLSSYMELLFFGVTTLYKVFICLLCKHFSQYVQYLSSCVYILYSNCKTLRALARQEGRSSIRGNTNLQIIETRGEEQHQGQHKLIDYRDKRGRAASGTAQTFRLQRQEGRSSIRGSTN